MLRVICVGNRYVYPDGAALWVYDEAIREDWPESLEWVEGGLGGLNLLPYFETRKKIILLDFMPHKANTTMCSLDEIVKNFTGHYGHGNALYYLLSSLPALVDPVPNITLMSCNPQEGDWKQDVMDKIRTKVAAHA